MIYEWVTARQTVLIVDNQHPGYPVILFGAWMRDGWEVVSVTPLPPTSGVDMCIAIGVLRRAVHDAEVGQ